MDNTYIQDKLDEFDKRFVYPLNFDFKVKENEPFLDDSSMADGYGSAADYLKEFLEQSLTDYHNHIVEMTNKKSQEYNGYEYSSVDHIAEASHYGYTLACNHINEVLQDTNPKE